MYLMLSLNYLFHGQSQFTNELELLEEENHNVELIMLPYSDNKGVDG
jgi:hypothetical protein